MTSDFRCLLCGGDHVAETISMFLRDAQEGEHAIVRCSSCGHVQLSPLPSPSQERDFYQKDLQTVRLMGETDFAQWRHKTEADTMRRIRWLNSLLRQQKGARVLDIGCGYGFFVDAAMQQGYDAVGIDVSDDRLLLAQTYLRGSFLLAEVEDVVCQKLPSLCGSFDAVTLFHVLEHMRDPIAFMQHCRKLVKPGGYLLIEVPNLADEAIEECVPYEQFYWQTAHLSYFDMPHLAQVIDRSDLRSYEIHGVQRYGLRNLLHWLDHGVPQLANPDFHSSGRILTRLEQMYKRSREDLLTCDTLIAEVHHVVE